MKNLSLYLICVLSLLLACRKSSPIIADNTISANIDGTTETFNKIDTARLTTNEKGYTLSISGTNAPNESIYIEVTSSSPIAKGNYPINISSQGFQIGTAVDYKSGYLQLFPDLNATSPNTVTITYISNTTVQGTFESTLTGRFLGNPTIVNKRFANGKFNVTIR